MIINFKSIISSNGKKKKIEFAATVDISKYQEFDVYEFKEPLKGEMNRIEIAKDKINIMAGVSTIELEMHKKVNIIYKDEKNNQLIFESFLHKLKKSNNKIVFEYSLFDKNNLIGNYKIMLHIKNFYQ